MKINKIFTGVFLLTFFIGIISFYFILKTEKSVEQVEITQTIPSDFPTSKIETRIKPEILEENDDCRDENKSKFKIKLLETGEFHGDDVKAKSGEIWLGLFKQGDDYFLSSTKIKVKIVFDAIVDDEEKGKKTGKGITVNGKNKPIFLLRNANFLKQEKVKTVFYKDGEDSFEETNINNETNKTFKLNDTTYNLFVTTDKVKEGWIDETSKLILTDGKTEQIIYTQRRCDDCGLAVYWAGDLDADGKLDLYFDLTDHYNVSQKRLFLSSQAEKGKLVKEVANFTTVGC